MVPFTGLWMDLEITILNKVSQKDKDEYRVLSLICRIFKSESEVVQSCPTLCNPLDCSLLGFSVHGLPQARILEWVTISFSRGSSRPRDWTQVSHIGGRHFNLWAPREAKNMMQMNFFTKQKKTHRLREQHYGYRGAEGGGEGDMGSVDSTYTHCCI